MNIAILGTGVVGRTVAARLSDLGFKVYIGTRNVDILLARKNKDNRSEFNDWYQNHREIHLGTFNEVSESSKIIFNCTSGMISTSVLNSIKKENLKDKILVDIANPLDFSNGMPPSLNPVNTTSLGEVIQEQYPTIKVVKTLNTMTAALMVEPKLIEGNHNVFVCGNDDDAKQQIGEILHKFGWKERQIIDLGDITNARATEMLLPIWLRLWNKLGTPLFNFNIMQ